VKRGRERDIDVGEKGRKGAEEREDVREWREWRERDGVGGRREGRRFIALDALISFWMVISNPI